MRVSATELSRKPRLVLAALERGEAVILTYRGKVKATIIAAGEKPRPHLPITEDPAFGMWKDREDMKDASAWVRAQRRPRYRSDQ